MKSFRLKAECFIEDDEFDIHFVADDAPMDTGTLKIPVFQYSQVTREARCSQWVTMVIRGSDLESNASRSNSEKHNSRQNPWPLFTCESRVYQ